MDELGAARRLQLRRELVRDLELERRNDRKHLSRHAARFVLTTISKV